MSIDTNTKKVPIKIFKWVEDQPARDEHTTVNTGGGEYPTTKRVYATYKQVFDCEGFFLGWGQEGVGGAPVTRALVEKENGACDLIPVNCVQFTGVGEVTARASFVAGMEEGRRKEAQECWEAINKQLHPELPKGNGCDERAQRNGMVLALDIISKRCRADSASPPPQ